MSKEIEFSSNYEFFNTDPKVIADAPNMNQVDSLPRVWVNGAKEGQVINVKGKICSMTREGLESSLGSWKDGIIFDNHSKQRAGFKIYDDRFESPFLAFLLDKVTADSLEKSGGGSIDGIALKIADNKILKMRGVGYSILEKGIVPSCTKEAGCGIPLAGNGTSANTDSDENELNAILDNVNIPESAKESITNIVLELKSATSGKEIKIKGGIKNMVDTKEEKPEVSYTKDQVAEIRAAAVTDTTEQLGNEHKVAMAELETVQKTAMDELKTSHIKALETQRTEVQKQSAMIESLATKYGLSDEAKKGLTDAKTIEDALTLFAGLEVKQAEPIVAAEAGKPQGGGILMGAAIEGKKPEIRKIEEIGTWDPYTKQYVPTYREEVI